MLCSVLALLVICQEVRPIDSQAVSEMFRSYGSSFKDVQFLYEGTMRSADQAEEDARTFQGYYAYRDDGATLIDVFGLPRNRKQAESRSLYAMLGSKMESFNATPDRSSRLSDREPEQSNGGPGALNRPDSPERIFLAYYLRTHVSPDEYGLETHGWDDVDGRRCLIVTVQNSPRSLTKDARSAESYTKLWLDLERGGNPLRIENYASGHLLIRTEVQALEQIPREKGPPFWMPVRGRTETYGVKFNRGKTTRLTKPNVFETHNIMVGTVRFDRGLADGFFSTKAHALVVSDEKLIKFQRELNQSVEGEKKPPRRLRSDPESVQKRLDEALVEADKRSPRLEASSAARASTPWWGALAWLLPPCGFLLVFVIYRRSGGRG